MTLRKFLLLCFCPVPLLAHWELRADAEEGLLQDPPEETYAEIAALSEEVPPAIVLGEKLASLRSTPQVLHVVGSLFHERYSSTLPAADAKPSPFEWWGSLRDPGSYKVEYSPLYTRLTNASSTFFEEAYLVASNGEIQFRLNHNAGQAGSVKPIRNATISRPPEMKQLQLHLLQSGMAAFLPVLQLDDFPITTPVEKALTSDATTFEPLGGGEDGWRVIHESQGGRRREEFRFSPDFGKLHERLITVYNPGRDRVVLQHEYKVAAFHDGAEAAGFAIPKEIHYNLRVQNSPERISIIRLDKVELLAGEEALHFDVPKGYRFNDRR